MKLAISNIAWDRYDDPGILEGLRDRGVTGIEVAPTKLWPDWVGASSEDALRCRQLLSTAGFDIPALQAILYGRTEFRLFDPACHDAMLAHFRLLAGIAKGLGASVMVFGSPKNRLRGQLSSLQAHDAAVTFFRRAAQICSEHDCCIGLEHNPVEYGCDFITNVADARLLVDAVEHEGFQLHLDVAGIHMCGPETGDIIRRAGHFEHFHISEPMLAPIHGGEVGHRQAAAALHDIGYSGWVSIEMKPVADRKALFDSVEAAADCYL